MGLQDAAGTFRRASRWTARDDGRSHFAEGARGDVDVAQHVVVLRAFVRDDLRHAAGADDEDVLLHFAR
jgi:hypothetical protein